MSRGKHGRPIHGWILLDKPWAVTSAQMVADVHSLSEA